MSAQINIATASDIDDIDRCNRTVLPENYDRAFYESLFASPNCCSFVVRFCETDNTKDAVDSTKASTEVTTATEVATAPKPIEQQQATSTEATDAKAATDAAAAEAVATVSETPLAEKAPLAGYILAAVQNDAKGALVGHVFSLGVYEQFRRKQFATVLMRCVETLLQKRYADVKCMVLHVRKHNRTAYQFYTKSGFGRAGIERRYYVRPTEDAYIMKKYF